MDLRILQEALAKEAAEEAADQAAKEAKRHEVRGSSRRDASDGGGRASPLQSLFLPCSGQHPRSLHPRPCAAQVLHYRRQLALSMQREAAARGAQDALIEAAHRAKQAAEDAEFAARAAARRRLMEEVVAIRATQVAAKQEQRWGGGRRGRVRRWLQARTGRGGTAGAHPSVLREGCVRAATT
jgi:hypothetical protein